MSRDRKCYLVDRRNKLVDFYERLNPFFDINPERAPEGSMCIEIVDGDVSTLVADLQDVKFNKRIPVLISGLSDEENVQAFLSQSSLNHLIGAGDHVVEELRAIASKYRSTDIFGLAHYLSPDSKIDQTQIYHSKDANDSTAELIESIDVSGFFDSPVDYLKIMANELITNAFYHMKDAPTHERKESIFLTPPQSIQFSVGKDLSRIALSVVDQSGTLSRDQLIFSLERSFREKTPRQRTPGAGLGLYLVYQYANQLIVNSRSHEKTEIIAIIEASKRYKNYKQRITSFHFFKEG
jgi:phosphoserine phosphatase RsbU/P